MSEDNKSLEREENAADNAASGNNLNKTNI